VVTSFNHLRPPERDLTPMSQMKAIKSLRHAGLTAVFTGQTVSWLAQLSSQALHLHRFQNAHKKDGNNYHLVQTNSNHSTVVCQEIHSFAYCLLLNNSCKAVAATKRGFSFTGNCVLFYSFICSHVEPK